MLWGSDTKKPPVLLLAAGSSSRFAPLATTQHKSFFKLCDVPFIYRTLENLAQHGFSQVHIVVDPTEYEKKTLLEYIAQNPIADIDVTFHCQQKPLGQGDALLQCTQVHETGCIIGSPYYIQLGLQATLLENERAGAQKTSPEPINGALWVSETDSPHEYGVVTLDGQNFVQSVVEKPQNLDTAFRLNSIYSVDATFFEVLKSLPTTEDSFEQALNLWSQRSRVWAYTGAEIGSLKYAWHVLDWMHLFLETMEQNSHLDDNKASIPEALVHDTSSIDISAGPVYLGPGVVVGPFSRIVGPCYIGAGAYIGDHCLIRNSALCAGSTAGAYTEIVNSHVGARTTLHQSYLADSILDQECKIGAGLMTANKRFDRNSVKTVVKDTKVDTQRRALGCIMAEKTHTGIRVSTFPGVLIEKESKILPASVIKKNITNA